MIPTISVEDKTGNELKSYNLPVEAHIIVKDGDKITSHLHSTTAQIAL